MITTIDNFTQQILENLKPATTIFLAMARMEETQKTTLTVAVTQIVEHPALNAVRDGLKEELAAQGFEADKNLKWQWINAQGNQSTAIQIAKKFAGEAPDAIVAISTPSA